MKLWTQTHAFANKQINQFQFLPHLVGFFLCSYLPTPHHIRSLSLKFSNDRSIELFRTHLRVFAIRRWMCKGDKITVWRWEEEEEGNRRNKDLSTEKCMHGKMACMPLHNYCFVDHYYTSLLPTLYAYICICVFINLISLFFSFK